MITVGVDDGQRILLPELHLETVAVRCQSKRAARLNFHPITNDYLDFRQSLFSMHCITNRCAFGRSFAGSCTCYMKDPQELIPLQGYSFTRKHYLILSSIAGIVRLLKTLTLHIHFLSS